ncbi:MAG: hypothetical protein ACI3VS_03465 [Evtepia sp.]
MIAIFLGQVNDRPSDHFSGFVGVAGKVPKNFEKNLKKAGKLAAQI